MRRRLLVPVVLAGTCWAASAASAVPCDSYSGGCPSPQPSATMLTAPPSTPPRTPPGGSLPFTGGEIVLMTTLGAGAVAAGTGLTVAGRRRR